MKCFLTLPVSGFFYCVCPLSISPICDSLGSDFRFYKNSRQTSVTTPYAFYLYTSSLLQEILMFTVIVTSLVDSAFFSFLFLTNLFQQPCVHDEVSGVSLVGLPALQTMLYHCQYFQHVALSASNCYQGRYTLPLQAYADTISGPDSQVVNLFGKPFFKSYYI